MNIIRIFKISKSGFTLVELLVVIAIIVILISASLIGLSGSRETARDAKRKTDLEAIRSALELYKSDNNKYPSLATENTCDSSIGSCGTSCYKVVNACSGGDWVAPLTALKQTTADLPKDLLNDTTNFIITNRHVMVKPKVFEGQ
jgi:prepilin-type N-terminal cleavage/methylation domain-containing protein